MKQKERNTQQGKRMQYNRYWRAGSFL